MKILLVSNGNLATSLIDSMNNYFSNTAIDAVCFACGHTMQGKADLEAYFKKQIAANSDGYLIFCDIFGSTAFNEVSIMVQKLNISKQTLIICGMNLPMLFKAYGLIDSANLKIFEEIYADYSASGIQICARTA